jgi:serine/threonine protein kinase
VLGNYELLDKLGQGGMGEVYRARHGRMDRVVALKILPAAATPSSDAVKRFQREARAAAKLSHPNIVMAYDADEAEGVHFFVMEYVPGRNLATLVRDQGSLSVATAIDYVSQIARGLEYAHQGGVIHRDIKPSNLMVDATGTVRILDMGLARVETGLSDRDDGLTRTGQVLGTHDYLSPEQAFDARHVDVRTDIYSLGCTLYFLLVGNPPYDADTPTKRMLAHRHQPIPALRDTRPDVPAELDLIFQRMLAKKPEARLATMRDVIAALETVAQLYTVSLQQTKPLASMGPASRFGGVAIPAAATGSSSPAPLAPVEDETAASATVNLHGPEASTSPSGSELPVMPPPPCSSASPRPWASSFRRLLREPWNRLGKRTRLALIGAAFTGGLIVLLGIVIKITIDKDKFEVTIEQTETSTPSTGEPATTDQPARTPAPDSTKVAVFPPPGASQAEPLATDESVSRELARLEQETRAARGMVPGDPRLVAIRGGFLDFLNQHRGTTHAQAALRIMAQLP